MLSEIEAFMTAHQLADVALVANAGMASEAQPEEIETAGLSFNNPRRGDPRPAHLHHVAHRAWTPWRRLCPRTPALPQRWGSNASGSSHSVGRAEPYARTRGTARARFARPSVQTLAAPENPA